MDTSKHLIDEFYKDIHDILRSLESHDTDLSDGEKKQVTTNVKDIMRMIHGKNYNELVIDEILNKVFEKHYHVNFEESIIDEIKNGISEDMIRRKQIFDHLKGLPQPEQKSQEWFKMREQMITASDIGTCLGVNKYQTTRDLLFKKCGLGEKFKENPAVYHGKKYEFIATLIYSHLYNVKVEEFGLIQSPHHPFLGASPDGICTMETLNGLVSKLIGRMLEIKCPLRRKIKMSGEEYGEICPKYYWCQVQIQLEVCDLDECDFLQCDIREYKSREEWLNDDTSVYKFYHTTEGKEIKMNDKTKKGAIIEFVKKIPQ